MLFFEIIKSSRRVTKVISNADADFDWHEMHRIAGTKNREIISWSDPGWTMTMAHEIARSATTLTGDVHLAVNNGPQHHPRFDVCRAPKVGDKCSYGFNGDYYPCGEITYVTNGSAFLVRTSDGCEFRRVKQTMQWKRTGGTWSLVIGHVDRRNPHV